MFAVDMIDTIQQPVVKKMVKPKSRIYNNQVNEVHMSNALSIDSILENEKQKNKSDTWNKLDKTIKMEKLVCCCPVLKSNL